ncbi:MAG: amidohydrolase [Actinomycetota bacterium]|nr:amidohydrolase [Actinomycetota bacterium]
MTADLILKASTIITMADAQPRAEAVAVDTATGTIVAVGTLADVQAAAPGVDVTDLGQTVLMPGFVEPHSHPILSGMVTQSPAYWIAPYMGFPTWADVQAACRKADAEAPAGVPLLFNGLDRLLQQAPLPTRVDLDPLFPSGRAAVILDNSGHAAYVNTATIDLLGWPERKPPADPVGGSFGRNPDGTSNGVAYELPAELMVLGPLLPKAVPHPLKSAAEWYASMASFGITSTSEHTYGKSQYDAYLALSSVEDCPLRLHVYHMSTEADAEAEVTWPKPAMVRKNGIKLWADGSPWVGNIATSFGYLDNDRTRAAQIELGPLAEKGMNYTRGELDAILDRFVPLGYQMAFHCNGDVGFDVVLDAYEHALARHGLLGSDHRWRVEHLGAARRDQFVRAASLGVTCSMSPFQYIYWGDLLDGTMFTSEIGSQWQALQDAFQAGVRPSFHHDGAVSPPDYLFTIQHCVTRTTTSGAVHGANQAVTLDQALRASTINGAYQLKRDHEIGSIEAGKLADFVELSADPYGVEPDQLVAEVQVLGTWLGGHRIDPKAFLAEVQAIDPSEHPDLAAAAVASKKCC